MRVLNYVKATKDDNSIIGSDNLLKLETWVDALHAVHEYIRGQTGGCMSYVAGIMHGKAPKQKFNTESTTELEVVAVS